MEQPSRSSGNQFSSVNYLPRKIVDQKNLARFYTPVKRVSPPKGSVRAESVVRVGGEDGAHRADLVAGFALDSRQQAV
jgi:hypothetical protein